MMDFIKDIPNERNTHRFKPYLEYKNSGVEWLGKIPTHWEIAKIKYSTYVKGRIGWQGLRADEFTDEGPYCVTGTDFENGKINWDTCYRVSHQRYLLDPHIHLKEGDLLITKDGTIGKTAIVAKFDGEATLNSGIFLTRPLDNTYLSEFLYWVLNSLVFEEFFSYEGLGSTIIHLYQETFEEFVFPKPRIPEQQAIVSFLDRETAKIDAFISKKDRLIDLLQEKRTTLISQTVTKGLDPNVPMKGSGIEWLGEIPAHWDLIPLKYCAVKKPNAIKTGPFGSQLLSSEMMSGEVKVYNQRSVLDYDFISGDNYITQDKFKDLISFMVEPGDILLTTRGTIGRCAIVPKDAEKGILHPCLMRIQPNISIVVPEYLVLLIQDSILVQTQIKLASNATTIDVIYSETMKEIRIPLSPLQEQLVITAAIDREKSKIDALIAKVHKAIDRLKEYRTALISAAVTGKIDVRPETI